MKFRGCIYTKNAPLLTLKYHLISLSLARPPNGARRVIGIGQKWVGVAPGVRRSLALIFDLTLRLRTIIGQGSVKTVRSNLREVLQGDFHTDFNEASSGMKPRDLDVSVMGQADI